MPIWLLKAETPETSLPGNLFSDYPPFFCLVVFPSRTEDGFVCHAYPEELLFLTLLLVCCECSPHWVIVTYVMPYASQGCITHMLHFLDSCLKSSCRDEGPKMLGAFWFVHIFPVCFPSAVCSVNSCLILMFICKYFMIIICLIVLKSFEPWEPTACVFLNHLSVLFLEFLSKI